MTSNNRFSGQIYVIKNLRGGAYLYEIRIGPEFSHFDIR